MSDQTAFPPELAARVRDYLGGLLTARDVEPAMAELASDVAYWGDDRPVDVFSAARTIVHSRMRVADDLEAIILHEDCGLSVDEVAQVMKRGPGDVRRLLDAAAVELAELDPAPGLFEESPSRPAAPVADEAPPVEPTREPAPPVADRTPAEHPVTADEAGIAAADLDDLDDLDELADLHDLDDLDAGAATPDGEPVLVDAAAPSLRTGAFTSGGADATEAESEPASRTVLLILAGALVVVILALIFRPSAGSPCPSGSEICVLDSTMASRIDDRSDPVDPGRDSFTTVDDVRLWFRFERDPSARDLQLTVTWYRGETELYPTPFRLPQGDRANVTLAKLFMSEPGDYRVVLTDGDGEVLAEESFRIIGASDA